MPLQGGGLRVTPAEVGGLAGEVTQALQTAAQLRPDHALDSAAPAVPGGLLNPACHDLAARWGRELRDLEQSLNHVADSLRAAAADYRQTEHATAAGFSDLMGNGGGGAGGAGTALAIAPGWDDIRRGSGRLW